MGIEILGILVVVLMAFAVADLVVGVSNDAVNFLTSSFGSRVAPRKVILLIASAGILVGVVFSSGMMEVARKGIFHPQLFTMPELMAVFLAVMLTDILLLDLFNTFGLPTSTTVSIVFELLGAAVAISLLKIAEAGEGIEAIGTYINTAKALTIIGGILLSVLVAFFFGALTQFVTRLIFTFDYRSRLRRYGSLWGGVAMASITYFILVKGAKGAAFLDHADVVWIKSHTLLILFGIFAVSTVALQILQIAGVHILKPIVLVGTFALALAFAANDLVNFIGVPLAGLHAYDAATATSDPLHVTMAALSGKVKSETALLLIAGGVMVLTLWLSRKARTVTQTEIRLGQQEEGSERFGSTALSRVIVRMVISLSNTVRALVPGRVRGVIARRMDTTRYQADVGADNRPSFDLLRASVNLMVASAVVSFATSYKLPLSTTYVTFMVAMGTSFADLAWGRDSAVYRVSGVLAVVGGWFVTAAMAFLIAGTYAVLVFYGGVGAVGALLLLTCFSLWKTHGKHKARSEEAADDEIFNLSHVDDAAMAIDTTFRHSSQLLHRIHTSLDAALPALFAGNEYALRKVKRRVDRIQKWANVIIANVFKTMRLQQQGDADISVKYPQTIRRLQKLADGHRDIAMRAFEHVSNHHKRLLDVQVEELEEIRSMLHDVLQEVETGLEQRLPAGSDSVEPTFRKLQKTAATFYERQSERIRDDSSKTRLSILYYAIVGNAVMMARQSQRLLDIYQQCFSDSPLADDPDLE